MLTCIPMVSDYEQSSHSLNTGDDSFEDSINSKEIPLLNAISENSHRDQCKINCLLDIEGVELFHIKANFSRDFTLNTEFFRYSITIAIPLNTKSSNLFTDLGIFDKEDGSLQAISIPRETDFHFAFLNFSSDFLYENFHHEFLEKINENLRFSYSSNKPRIIVVQEASKNIFIKISEIFLYSNSFHKQRVSQFIQFKLADLIHWILFRSVKLNDSNDLKQKIKFSSDDIKRIQKAKDILISDIENPPTIMDLSRRVGINSSKLKIGFKRIFGLTIFSYLTNYRMNKAYQLLQGKEMNVTEVAFLVGYSSLSKFTIAFRKKFGFNPSYISKTRKNEINAVTKELLDEKI